MTMVNERDGERKSGSSICWARDTEKIFEPNKIKNNIFYLIPQAFFIGKSKNSS